MAPNTWYRGQRWLPAGGRESHHEACGPGGRGSPGNPPKMCSCTYSIHGDTRIHTHANARTHVHAHHLTNSAAPVPARAAGRASGTLEAQGAEALPPDPLPGLLLPGGASPRVRAWPCPPELSLDLLEGAGTGRQPPTASGPCWDWPALVSCHKSSNNTSRGGLILV